LHIHPQGKTEWKPSLEPLTNGRRSNPLLSVEQCGAQTMKTIDDQKYEQYRAIHKATQCTNNEIHQREEECAIHCRPLSNMVRKPSSKVMTSGRTSKALLSTEQYSTKTMKAIGK